MHGGLPWVDLGSYPGPPMTIVPVDDGPWKAPGAHGRCRVPGGMEGLSRSGAQAIGCALGGGRATCLGAGRRTPAPITAYAPSANELADLRFEACLLSPSEAWSRRCTQLWRLQAPHGMHACAYRQ